MPKGTSGLGRWIKISFVKNGWTSQIMEGSIRGVLGPFGEQILARPAVLRGPYE